MLIIIPQPAGRLTVGLQTIFLFEFIYAAALLDKKSFRTGVKRMAGRANLNLDLFFGGAGLKSITACADDFRLIIIGMDTFLHIGHLFFPHY